MKKDRIPSYTLGLMIFGAALIFWIPIFVRPIAKAILDGTPEQWLSFAGSVIGAFATLAAAGLALFAAYRTIKPVREQLDELVKQNEYAAFDRLRRHAEHLNTHFTLNFRANKDAEVLDRWIEEFIASHRPTEVLHSVELSFDRLAATINELQNSRGDVWGNKATQVARDEYIDAYVRLGQAAETFIRTARKQKRAVGIFSKKQIQNWRDALSRTEGRGTFMYSILLAETKRTRRMIGRLEERLFSDAD